MTGVEKQWPGKTEQAFVMLIQIVRSPGVRPEVGAHLCSHATTFIIMIRILSQHNVNVVALGVWSLPFPTCAAAHMGGVGVDDKGRKPHDCALTNRPSFRGQPLQLRA